MYNPFFYTYIIVFKCFSYFTQNIFKKPCFSFFFCTRKKIKFINVNEIYRNKHFKIHNQTANIMQISEKIN